MSKPKTRHSRVEEEVVVKKESKKASASSVVNLNVSKKESSSKAKSVKAEKTQKEVKNATTLGFESKNEVVPDKFSNPFGGSGLGMIAPSKVQSGRIGKTIKEEKPVVVNSSKSFNTKN